MVPETLGNKNRASAVINGEIQNIVDKDKSCEASAAVVSPVGQRGAEGLGSASRSGEDRSPAAAGHPG